MWWGWRQADRGSEGKGGVKPPLNVPANVLFVTICNQSVEYHVEHYLQTAIHGLLAISPIAGSERDVYSETAS